MLLSRKWLNEFVPVEAKDRAFAEDMTPLRLQGGGYRGRRGRNFQRGGWPRGGDQAP